MPKGQVGPNSMKVSSPSRILEERESKVIIKNRSIGRSHHVSCFNSWDDPKLGFCHSKRSFLTAINKTGCSLWTDIREGWGGFRVCCASGRYCGCKHIVNAWNRGPRHLWQPRQEIKQQVKSKHRPQSHLSESRTVTVFTNCTSISNIHFVHRLHWIKTLFGICERGMIVNRNRNNI